MQNVSDIFLVYDMCFTVLQQCHLVEAINNTLILITLIIIYTSKGTINNLQFATVAWLSYKTHVNT